MSFRKTQEENDLFARAGRCPVTSVRPSELRSQATVRDLHERSPVCCGQQSSAAGGMCPTEEGASRTFHCKWGARSGAQIAHPGWSATAASKVTLFSKPYFEKRVGCLDILLVSRHAGNMQNCSKGMKENSRSVVFLKAWMKGCLGPRTSITVSCSRQGGAVPEACLSNTCSRWFL